MSVAIVGGGVVGLSAAYQLAREGLQVVVLEAGRCGEGASSNNAGWIVPIMAGPITAPGSLRKALKWSMSRTSPFHISIGRDPSLPAFLWRLAANCRPSRFERTVEVLARLSANVIAQFEAYRLDGVDFEMRDDGILMAFLERHNLGYWRDQLDRFAAIGHTYSVLSQEEVHSQHPYLADGVEAAISCAAERRVDPVTLLAGLARRCRELGVEIHEHCRVDGVRRAGNRVLSVRSGHEEFNADVVVLAAGADTGRLARRLTGVGLPVMAGKGYGFDVPLPDTLMASGLYLAEARVNISPLSRGLRVSGVMDIGSWSAGGKVRRARGVIEAPRQYLRAWTTPADAAFWTGIRPMTPDGRPIIGRLGNHDNLLVATGHSMVGVTLAPATATLIADLIAGRADPQVVAELGSSRFARS